MSRRSADFQTIRSEGGLLPADLLRRVIDPRANLIGTKPEDYGLPASERLNEVITQSWNRLRRHWAEFRAATANLPETEAGTGVTNDKWSLPLLRELGFGLLPTSAGPEIGGRTYAISRFFGPVPVHLVGCGLSLDRRAAGQRGAAAGNPHGLLQEFLNRSPGHVWGIVSNGMRFRILRDNQALSRQSFIEFDLEAMFTGEIYADFVLLWLVAHATRFAPREGSRPDTCWLEIWTKEAEEQGTRALTDLRGGVERALQVLGEGFTSHPQNTALRDALRSGSLSPTDFHGQLLRVVYRLIFLFVAEDRTLEGLPLLHPRDNSEAARAARERYATHYSTGRLRDLAGEIKGSRHGDLWRQFQLLVTALSGDAAGEPIRQQLALPSLGSFLWNPTSTAALNDSELTNFDFLEALRHLAFTRQGKVLRPVDYKNLGSEELGGVYESLLALTPQISADGARFTFAEFAGNERKISGAYYTPDPLVQCLLDSALDPVVKDAVKGKSGVEAEKAILALKVCDPAVGSGHFLVGAAHRLARHLARVRALAQGEGEPSPLLYQHALRDVIGRCLYGVDMNPMAAELCRVGLWLEALEPGKPLSFLDHHIRVGNSLLGTTPELISAGLPDEAFTAIEGDDKKACAALKKRNRAERKGLGPLFAQQDAETQARLQQAAATLEELPDDRPEDVRTKELAFRHHEETPEYHQKKMLADAWCAAFFIQKRFNDPGRETNPIGITQGHLNDLASGRPIPVNVAVEVEMLAREYHLFQWHLSFPEVFGTGGFDCILGNPPWEVAQVNDKEFFATREPEIANLDAAKRKRAIRDLQQSNPHLFAEYSAACRTMGAFGAFTKSSNRFPLTKEGKGNLYSFFAELALNLVRKTGRIGMILQSGIVTDASNRDFLAKLIAGRNLVSFLDFVNTEGIFPGVHRTHPHFALTTISGSSHSEDVRISFHNTNVQHLLDERRYFGMDAKTLEIISPNTKMFPAFRSGVDAELTKKIYRSSEVILREDSGEVESNPWQIEIVQNLFSHTNDGDLFVAGAELAKLPGATLVKNFWKTDNGCYAPLYEAKMVDQYDHRYGSFITRGDARGNRVLPPTHSSDYENVSYEPQPHSWVHEKEINDRLLKRDWKRSWQLGWKDITTSVTERTTKAFFLPRCATDDTISIFVFKGDAWRDALLFIAALNSLVFDFNARQKVSGLHLRRGTMIQLPIPLKGRFTGKARAFIEERVLELSCTSELLLPLGKDFASLERSFTWNEQRRMQIRAELDAVYAHLYGLTRDELRYILDPADVHGPDFPSETFRILKESEIKQFNEYRTARLVLQAWDHFSADGTFASFRG